MSAGCSKKPFSKAASSEEARRYVPHFVWAVRPCNGSWRTEKPRQYFRPPRGSIRYVEPLSEARTKPGERCVLAHLGWAGEKSDLFSILPGETDAGRKNDQLLYAARTFAYRHACRY